MKEYIYYFYPEYNLTYSSNHLSQQQHKTHTNNSILHNINLNNLTLNNTIPYEQENDFVFLLNFFSFTLLIFCFAALYVITIKCFTKQPNTNTLTSNVILLDKEEEEICSICLIFFKNGDQISRLNCGHLFHTNCVNKWISNKKNCPLCRINI